MKSILKANALVIALALLISSQVLAQATNVTGEWTFNVTTDQGGGTPTLVRRMTNGGNNARTCAVMLAKK